MWHGLQWHSLQAVFQDPQPKGCATVRALGTSCTCDILAARGFFVQITASKLRENVYRILDDAIATGTPVEVIRKGTVLKIVPEKRVSKLSRLKKRSGFDGDPDDIIGMDWLKEWTEIK